MPENFARKRVAKKIKMKAVLEHSKEAAFRMTDPEIKKITQIRFLNTIKKIPTVTFIFGKKVAKFNKKIYKMNIVCRCLIKTKW